ncbi:hypothetical protein [Litoribacillus peritrichatus]|uniref:DUF485 domain-containing protein n=1 Tax=Litoribacillus peritrichatus TaxID=718191 RepID=A0ABP7M1H1_9GAMM
MTNERAEAHILRAKLLKFFKIYGIILWGLFLIGAVLLPSLAGLTEDDLKPIASRAFVALLAAYFIPYYVSWKIFERKHGPLDQFKEKTDHGE